LLGQNGQAFNLLGPHALQRILERPEAGQVRLVVTLLPHAPRSHKTGVVQDPQMLGDGGEAHVEVPRNIAGTPLAVPDQTKDLPAAGLGDDLQLIHQNIVVGIEMRSATSYNVART